MGLRLIRQSSDTPNVSNTDDVRMVRYAYGGADGVVKNYGTELAPTINGNTLKIGSGCVVLHGWEVVVDANGYDVAVDNIDVLRYYSVYLEINLATESFAIKTLYDTAGYPEVETGEDLTAQTTGTAQCHALVRHDRPGDGRHDQKKNHDELAHAVTVLISIICAGRRARSRKKKRCVHDKNSVFI